MKHTTIFRQAWDIARDKSRKKLLWFGFIPAFFTTIVTSLAYSVRGYQTWIEAFQGGSIVDVFFEFIRGFWTVITSNPAFGTLLILGIILFTLGYVFIPIIFQGGLMKLLGEVIDDKPNLRYRMGVIYGSRYFFKLFEFKALFAPFRLTYIFVVYWAIRTFEPELLGLMLPPLIIWFIVAAAVNILFIFCEYFIVLQDTGVIDSVKKSVRMVFLNLEQVLYVIALMFLIAFRVVFNIVVTFGIPLMIIFLAGFFASSIISSIALILAILAGIAALIGVAYINGIIVVFITAAWTLIFNNYLVEMEDKA